MATRQKKTRGGKRKESYPAEYRLQALELLKKNRGNYNKTAKELGIAGNTLKNWYLADNKQEERDKIPDYEQLKTMVVAAGAENDGDFMEQVRLAKATLIKRITTMANMTRNLDQLQRTLRTLCEIDGTLRGEDRGEKSSTMLLVEQLTQNFKYEPKSIHLHTGDTKESA